MLNKLEKLKEVNITVNHLIRELETRIFINEIESGNKINLIDKL